MADRIIQHAGDLHYIAFGGSRVWFYVEWGDGLMLWLWKLRIRVKVRWSRV